MKRKIEFEQERRKAAEYLAELNRKSCIHFAEMLRLQDQAERIMGELGQPKEELIPKQYCEMAYRVLSFGTFHDRAIVMLGTAKEIENLFDKIQYCGGFHDEKGFFIEVPGV